MSYSNQEIRRKIKANLEGYWEYKYEVLSGSGFQGGEIARGGIMLIKTKTDWTGLSAQITAQRLWGERSIEKAFGINKEMSWEFLCKVTLHISGVLGFTSFITNTDERAYTETTYKTTSDFSLESGEFEYYRDDKEIVEGKVAFRNIEDKSHLEWAPNNIKFSVEEVKSLLSRKTFSNDEISGRLSLSAIA